MYYEHAFVVARLQSINIYINGLINGIRIRSEGSNHMNGYGKP